jgi:hypothetical protein
MRKVTLHPILPLVISLIIFPTLFSQAADSQLAWVKTVVPTDTFTGKVVRYLTLTPSRSIQW